MGFIKLICRESRRDERSSRRRRRERGKKRELNENINGCQSIPGAGAAGKESEGERHTGKGREDHIDVNISIYRYTLPFKILKSK